jgi:hypothetical protein
MTLKFKKSTKLTGKWKLLCQQNDVEILIQFLDKNPMLKYNAIYSESQIIHKKSIKKSVIPFNVDFSRNGKMLRFKYPNSSKIEIFVVTYIDSSSLKLIELQTDSKFELIRNE